MLRIRSDGWNLNMPGGLLPILRLDRDFIGINFITRRFQHMPRTSSGPEVANVVGITNVKFSCGRTLSSS
jgi:hypothetical protein